MGSIAITLEENGIPTVAFYNERHEARFMGVVLSKGYIDYPAINFNEYDTFTSDGIKTLAPEAFQFLVKGLTEWKPEYMMVKGEKWVPMEEEFSYTAATHEEAREQFNLSYLKMGWGDGLPLVPPTRECVDAMLGGTPISSSTVIGTWGPSNAEFTVEKIAIVSAMAGARPTYMPVIIAALKAITSVKWDSYWQTQRATAPLVIVNGPYAKEIGINSSSNVFGPNSGYPANGAIGRAINLAMSIIPGNGRGIKPSNLAGNPATYAGIVIAEAEGVMSLGEGWDPVSVQLGYPSDTNLVTVLGIDQMDMSMTGSIANVAATVAPNKDIWPRSREAWEAQYAGALVVTEMQIVTAGLMGGATKSGYAKELWDLARIPIDKFKDLILKSEFGGPVEPSEYIKSLLAEPEVIERGVPVAAAPDKFLVVATGGH
ncbi:MAG: hypothetical protein JW896_10170 [Deltaproteobacteria bacterium]|nr:hypothetical protein [Deltaproteobacteria bacterium]